MPSHPRPRHGPVMERVVLSWSAGLEVRRTAWLPLHGSCYVIGPLGASCQAGLKLGGFLFFLLNLFLIKKPPNIKKHDFALNTNIKLFYIIFIGRAGLGRANRADHQALSGHPDQTVSCLAQWAWLEAWARPGAGLRPTRPGKLHAESFWSSFGATQMTRY
jgi:hypothetical protein